jgi:lipoprotein-releasing system permease protein
MRRFTVVGAFEFGEFENDSSLALIHMDDAARLLRMPPGTAGACACTCKTCTVPGRGP